MSEPAMRTVKALVDFEVTPIAALSTDPPSMSIVARVTESAVMLVKPPLDAKTAPIIIPSTDPPLIC